MGQGPDRRAHNPFETVITADTVDELAPLWTATTDGGVGPPVVSNSGVHVTDSAALYTFDKATGARRWTYPEPASIAGAIDNPIADGSRVLFTGGLPVGFGGAWSGSAIWMDARTGALGEDVGGARVTGRRGTHLAGFSVHGSPETPFTMLVLEVIDEGDPSAGWTGTLQFSFNGLRFAPPTTLGAERLYYAGPATESYDPVANVTGVRAFPVTAPATCAVPPEGWPVSGSIPCPLWDTPTAGRPVTSPVLGPGESVLYLGTDDGSLLALDAADGDVLWTAALGATASADPALADGWLYVPLANGDLAVLRADGCGAATCDAAWRTDIGGAGEQPAVAGRVATDGVVLVGTDAGQLVAVRAAGCGQSICQPLWHHDFGGPVTGAPAVSGGRVYVGVAPDQVVALAP